MKRVPCLQRLSVGLAGSMLMAAACAAAAEPPGMQLEAEARQRLAVQADDVVARFDLARALSWQQRWDEAQPIFEALLSDAPDDPDYLLGLAQVWRGRGQPRQALPLLARARSLAPRYEDVRRSEISALIDTEDPSLLDRARALREEARDVFPQSVWLFPVLDTPASQVALARAARAGASGTSPRTVIELAGSHDTLSGGRRDWQGARFTVERHLGHRRLVYASAEHTRRFNQDDDYFQLGAFFPVAALTTAQVEAAVSPTHRVRSSRRLLLQVQRALPRGWELGAGVRLARYDSGSTRQFNLGVERYRGAHRVGYSLFVGGPEGAGNVLAHRVQWAYHTSDRSWVGVGASWGRETEHDGGNLRTRAFRAAALSGRHELSTHWALIWDVGWNHYRQGYSRVGLHLGIRRTF